MHLLFFFLAPGHLDEAIQIGLEFLETRTFLRVHRHALPPGDKTDDGVTGDRIATFGEAYENVILSFDENSLMGLAAHPPDKTPELGVFAPVVVRNDSLGQETRGHLARRDPAESDGGQKFLLVLEVEGIGGTAERIRLEIRLGLHLVALKLVFEKLFPQAGGPLALLLPHPEADLLLGPGRHDELEPVPPRRAVGVGEYLDHIPVFEPRIQRNDPPVHLCAHAMLAHFGVDSVGKIDGSGAFGEAFDLALGGENENFVLKQIEAHRINEVFRIGFLLKALHDAPEPFEFIEIALFLLVILFVAPVGGDPLLGHPVHLPGANLEFHALAPLSHHRRMQGLVEVRLGEGDIVLKAAGYRLPHRMEEAEHGIAVLHLIDDDPQARDIVDLVEVEILDLHLPVNARMQLEAGGGFSLDFRLFERLAHRSCGVVQVGLAVLESVLELFVDLLKFFWVEVLEGDFLKSALEPPDTQAVGQGGVNLGRLPRDALPAGRRQVGEGHGVVEPVGQLD